MSDNQEFDDGDFFEDEYVPTVNRWKLLGAGLAVLIVAGFGIGIWYAYDQGVKKGVQLAPPIIKADTSPVKEKPEDPGGMEIPHQDKKVFNVLNAEKEEEKVEKLMKAPETPVKDPAPVEISEDEKPASSLVGKAENLMKKAEEKAADVAKSVEKKAEEVNSAVEEKVTEVAKATESVATTAKEKVEDVVKEVTDTATAVTGTSSSSTPTSETKVEKVIEAEKEAKKVAVAVPKEPAIKGPAYRVQLGAFRSTDAAEKAWLDLQKKHDALLQGLPHKVQSIEISGKGMFYRLQAGAYADRGGANELCTNLKKVKQDCLIARN
ncbi:hypothetical protein GUA87_12605 [Sneathiella sp. P13V-1]|uniref:SPOR domain-containing protein n=1 Tax=Sneathiella sp. P13V-1 TaxID=2697366 RepID=UPI00187B31F4|nr:SPOR domain-containing protein [Sneathiella sp. P13V-1]MBE7637688.1 hypothetical protein [Sneathiella sp. P13V-1]